MIFAYQDIRHLDYSKYQILNQGVMKMKKDCLTDEQVEKEIERLKKEKTVKLAKKEQALKYKRRLYMYCLRNLEKRGKQLIADGITERKLEEMYAEED